MMINMIIMGLMMLFDFSSSDKNGEWRVINDVVMGGRSSSQVVFNKDNCLQFSGVVSLENNGGFASCRSPEVNFNIADYREVIMKVKGDGKKYDLRLWTDSRWDGVSYVQDFSTKAGEWIELRLPIDKFKPRFRGRWLNDYPRLDKRNIKQVGILIAEKQEGEFMVLVDWIKVE